MRILVSFAIDLSEGKTHDGMMEWHQRNLDAFLKDSFVGQFITSEGIRWDNTIYHDSILLIDPTDAQVVALTLAEDTETLIISDEKVITTLLNTALPPAPFAPNRP